MEEYDHQESDREVHQQCIQDFADNEYFKAAYLED